jgi:hypothetical protein
LSLSFPEYHFEITGQILLRSTFLATLLLLCLVIDSLADKVSLKNGDRRSAEIVSKD